MIALVLLEWLRDELLRYGLDPRHDPELHAHNMNRLLLPVPWSQGLVQLWLWEEDNEQITLELDRHDRGNDTFFTSNHQRRYYICDPDMQLRMLRRTLWLLDPDQGPHDTTRWNEA